MDICKETEKIVLFFFSFLAFFTLTHTPGMASSPDADARAAISLIFSLIFTPDPGQQQGFAPKFC